MFGEQSVWRSVHEKGAEAGLDETGIAELRMWASERMRDQPFAVFSSPKASGERVMRPSFAIAIEHAARNIADGDPPDCMMKGKPK